MQAKLLLLFVLVAGSVVAYREDYGYAPPVGQGPIGTGKREVRWCVDF